MGETHVPHGLFSMGDVAELCRVRRPVVTMWRQRPLVAGDRVPFPPPTARVDDIEMFDSASVVTWLQRTGRGNNPEAHLDAAAFIRPPLRQDATPPGDDAVTALLCLRALAGRSLDGLDSDDLVDLADEVDPDDEVLYAEVERLGADAPRLARYVEAVVEAAYSVAGATESVQARSARARGQGARSVTLAPEAHEVVARLVTELAVDLDSTSVIVQDATDGATDLTRAAIAALGHRLDCTLVIAGDSQPARARRREALIHAVPLRTSVPVDVPAVVLAQLPHAADPGMTPAQMLTAVDDIQLELGPNQRAVILGPSAVLCDQLTDPETDRHRDHLIRGLGRLRAAVRLPEGLVVGRSRQRLGLWVLGPPQPEARDQRWVAVADLVGQALTPSVIDDLVTDLVTVMAPMRIGMMHAFHFAAVTPTATLLSSTGDLVTPGVRPRGLPDARFAEAVLAVERALSSLRDQPLPRGLDGWAVHPAGESAPPRVESLGTLVRMRGVTRVPGARMATLTPSASGGVRVLGVDDVFADGEATALYVDPLTLEAQYSQARRTEPGDVVFVTTPRPAARVDRDGLSVVRSPAMVLRCADGSDVLPEVLAATINALHEEDRSWRTWRIPRVGTASARELGDALHEVTTERRQIRSRLRMLDELSTRLIDGVATGAMTVVPTIDAR